MSGFSPRTLLRAVLYTMAVLVIGLALLVGSARLLLPLVPQYQDDIRAWASEATGYDIAFGSMSASWPLSGPELSFLDVRLGLPGEEGPIVVARDFSIGLSILRSLRDGRFQPSRVAIRGSRLTVERLDDGDFRIQGHPLAELLPGQEGGAEAELDLELEDIRFEFIDARREPRQLSLLLRWLRAGLRRDGLSARLSLGLPSELGQQIDAQLKLPLPLPDPLVLPSDWELQVRGTGLHLVPLLGYALGETGALQQGHGGVDARLAFHEGRVQKASLQLDLAGLSVAGEEEQASYDRIAGQAQWQRTADGWAASIKGLQVQRDGRESPLASAEIHRQWTAGNSTGGWTASAPFLRLDDLFPLVQAGLAGTEIEGRLPRQLAGDLHDVVASLEGTADGQPLYSVALGFGDIMLSDETGDVAAAGLTGRLAADNDGGRLELDSSGVAITLAQWFRGPLPADSLKGMVVWRRGDEGLRFLSDDILMHTAAVDISSRLELMFPAGGGSPVLDLKAKASADVAPEVLRYLPLNHFPAEVGDWLERAVVAGRVPEADGVFSGPLDAFPFDDGEGRFRIAMHLEDGILDYVDDWPVVEDLDAEVVFDGASMSSVQNSARVGNLPVDDFVVRIPDMRSGVLTVAGEERLGLGAVLDFLRDTPVADHAGAVLQRASASGQADAALRLLLPLTDTSAWKLDLLLDPLGARLALAGLPLDFTDVRGRLRLENTYFHGDGLQAVMLGEPVRASLSPQKEGRDKVVAQLVRLEGITPVRRLTDTFELPLREHLDGWLGWTATVRIPDAGEMEGEEPLTVTVHSDLQGTRSSLPSPLAKGTAERWPAELELAFPQPDIIDLGLRLEPPFSAALRLVTGADEQWQVERGGLHAGEGTAVLPSAAGLEVTGQVAELDIGEWLSVGDFASPGNRGQDFGGLFRRFAFEAERVAVAGQLFREVRAEARHDEAGWRVEVDGRAAQGTIIVPLDMDSAPMRVDMQRLWLEEEAPESGKGLTDPRDLMAVEARIADAAIGEWRLGELEFSVTRAADGLALEHFSARAPSLDISGDGGWRVLDGDASQQRSQLRARLGSTDVGTTLERLGFDAGISGKSADVRAELSWPGGPGSDFLQRASGHIGVNLKSGQVSEVEPGSGRLVGLLSVTALPRRLALDFHDVLDKGLRYDLIEGDFRLAGGSAYTCNLGLSSPAVEIGIIGRTALIERNYDQIAVVRPQLATTVLTAGGAVLGGPVGGVTMLLISQMFRKSLGSLGESYYRVTGDWDEPEVLRVQDREVDATAFRDCEREIEAALADPAGTAAPPPPIPRNETEP